MDFSLIWMGIAFIAAAAGVVFLLDGPPQPQHESATNGRVTYWQSPRRLRK
jgi:hypothetical protein